MASLTNVSGEPLELALQQGEIAKRLIDPGETVDISDYILAGTRGRQRRGGSTAPTW